MTTLRSSIGKFKFEILNMMRPSVLQQRKAVAAVKDPKGDSGVKASKPTKQGPQGSKVTSSTPAQPR